MRASIDGWGPSSRIGESRRQAERSWQYRHLEIWQSRELRLEGDDVLRGYGHDLFDCLARLFGNGGIGWRQRRNILDHDGMLRADERFALGVCFDSTRPTLFAQRRNVLIEHGNLAPFSGADHLAVSLFVKDDVGLYSVGVVHNHIRRTISSHVLANLPAERRCVLACLLLC